MKQRRILIIVVLTVILANGVLVWLALRPKEPGYQGKPLSEWLEVLQREQWTENNPSPARDAIQHMGTDAIPYLLKLLRKQIRPYQAAYNQWNGRHQWFAFYFTQKRSDYEKARVGFRALGVAATSAIPALVKLIEAQSKNKALNNPYPMWALEAIGPSAVPPLIQFLKDSNSTTRANAAFALGRIGAGSERAIPKLLEIARKDQLGPRYAAVEALGRIAKEPEWVVPVLIERMSDPDLQVCRSAAISLGRFARQAKAALPVLKSIISNKTNYPADFIHVVETVIKVIDRETAAQLIRQASRPLKKFDSEAAAKARTE